MVQKEIIIKTKKKKQRINNIFIGLIGVEKILLRSELLRKSAIVAGRIFNPIAIIPITKAPGKAELYPKENPKVQTRIKGKIKAKKGPDILFQKCWFTRMSKAKKVELDVFLFIDIKLKPLLSYKPYWIHRRKRVKLLILQNYFRCFAQPLLKNRKLLRQQALLLKYQHYQRIQQTYH